MTTFGTKIGTYSFGTSAFTDALKIVSGRRIEQFPIVRSDLNIIPESKATPIRIDISGTVFGSDYTSLRTAVRDIKRAVDGTKKSFYIDDDRYIRVISKSFDYSIIRQDYANFAASFLGEMPYFLAVYASSYISLPATTITYPIGNNGDVQIPFKIVILAPDGGIPAGTTVQFENKTNNLLLTYTGALTATQSLVIDSGYDDYNRPTFKVELDGVSAMSAFEGDFMAIEPGTNWLSITGLSVATVSLYWRHGFLS